MQNFAGHWKELFAQLENSHYEKIIGFIKFLEANDDSLLQNGSLLLNGTSNMEFADADRTNFEWVWHFILFFSDIHLLLIPVFRSFFSTPDFTSFQKCWEVMSFDNLTLMNWLSTLNWWGNSSWCKTSPVENFSGIDKPDSLPIAGINYTHLPILWFVLFLRRVTLL